MKYSTTRLLNNAVFEALEHREMMSASPGVSFKSGVLTVNGAATQANRVMIDLASNGQQMTVDVNGQHQTFASNQVTKLNVTTGSGSDYIYINPAIDIPENIQSGDSNDTIRGGGGNDTIISGNGSDWIMAKGESNFVQAGNGNDTLLGDKNSNTLIAGNGNDYLSSLGEHDHLTAGTGNNTFSIGSDGHDTVTAGSGHDVVTGGLTNNYLYVKSSASASSSTGSTSSNSTTASNSTASTKTSTGSTTTSTSASGSSAVSTSSGSTTTASKTTTATTTASKTTTTTSSGTATTASGSTGTASTGQGSTVGATAPISPITIAVTNPTNVPSNERPTAIMNVMTGPRNAGTVVNVNGLNSITGSGTCITTNYSWNFGDPNTQYNVMTGYNAAHVYDTPGNYAITLTVTNNLGAVSETTQHVTISATQRNSIYVNSTYGSDSNNGSENSPLKTVAEAFTKIQDNTEILLAAGQSFVSNASLHIDNTNVLIGRYGSGANPVIMRTLGNGLSTIATFSNSNGVTIEDITFNSPYSASTLSAANKIGLGGIFLGGQNLCVRDCTFMNVDDAINENGNPTGVLIQSNSAPLAIGLRGYMVWGQGAQQVIIGNYAANTTKEHIVRLVGLNQVTVEDNNFTNHDGKGCIEMHEGQYGWIVGNTVDGGDIRVGPLGLWGEAASSQTDYCVIEDNQLTDTFIYVQSGTHHAMIANNVINNNGHQAITISGVDSQGRTSQDITIENNTAIDQSANGNFLQLGGYASGIVLKDNLWIAPNLVVGSYGAAPVYVDDNNLSSFTSITGNIWPAAKTLGTYAAGGINFVGTAMASSGYLTPEQWNNQGPVSNDQFENVTLDGTYQVKINSQVAGAAMKMAA